jgi:hypothetical protein
VYRLTLTAEDVRTIAFVGERYGWSSALLPLQEGENLLREHEAWEIAEKMEEDTEGGHSYFPLLDQRSELAEKLFAFMESIV